MKDVLLKVVAELEDLRANQVLLAQRVGTGVSPLAAANAKKEAMKENQQWYEELRKDIAAL